MVSDASDDELASQPSGLRKSTCIAAANATSSTESKEEDEEGEDGDEEDQDPVEEDEEEAHRVHVHQRCNDTGISQAFQGLGLRASSKSVHGVVLGQPDGQGITPKLSLSDIASGTRAFWGKFGCHDWNVKHVFNLFLMINIFLATLGRSMAKPAGVGGPTFDFTEDDKVSVNSNGQWRSALVQAFKLMFGLVEHEVEEVWRIMVLSMTKAAPSWKCFYKGKNGDKKICRMWWCMAVGYKPEGVEGKGGPAPCASLAKGVQGKGGPAPCASWAKGIVPLPVTIPTASVPSPAAGKRPSETSPKARDRSKKAKPASSATAIGGATPKSIKPEEAPPEAAPAVADEYSLEDAQLDLLDMLTPVVEFAVSPANDGGQVLVKWLESFETLEQLQSSSGGLLSEGSMGQKLVNHAYAVKHDTEKCRKLLKGLGILR
eukprot:gene2957-12963_t